MARPQEEQGQVPDKVPQEGDFDPKDIASMAHIGQMMGPVRDDFDEEVHQRLQEHEANFKKMHAAQTGGANPDLGAGQMENAQVKQRQALSQQATMQGAQQAAQAQAGSPPLQPPVEAPGPQGAQTPYKAQAGPQPQPQGFQPPPGAQPGQPPEEQPGQ